MNFRKEHSPSRRGRRLFVLLAATYLSIPVFSQIEKTVDVVNTHPQDLLRQLFDKYPGIPDDVKARFESALSTSLNDRNSVLTLDQFSPVRRRLLNEEIASRITQYATERYNSQSQRDVVVDVFAGNVDRFFKTPVFQYTPSPELDGQLAQLADEIAAESINRFPDVSGSSIPDLLKETILKRFADLSENDMIPTMKCPMSEEEFAAYKNDLSAAIGAAKLEGPSANGRLSPRWDVMSESEKKQYLQRSSDAVAHRILGGFGKTLFDVQAKYYSVALRDKFSEVDLSAVEKIKQPDLSGIVAKASEERQVAFQEERERRKREMEMRRLELQMKSAAGPNPAERPIDVGLFDLDAQPTRVPEKTPNPGAAPLPSAAASSNGKAPQQDIASVAVPSPVILAAIVVCLVLLTTLTLRTISRRK